MFKPWGTIVEQGGVLGVGSVFEEGGIHGCILFRTQYIFNEEFIDSGNRQDLSLIIDVNDIIFSVHYLYGGLKSHAVKLERRMTTVIRSVPIYPERVLNFAHFIITLDRKIAFHIWRIFTPDRYWEVMGEEEDED